MNEVKSPKKPLLYYYVVALLVVMLFNFIAMPWMAEHQIKEVDYNTFVTMTEQGEVGKVEIQQQDNRILFTSADEKTVYKTAMVPDDGLVQRLLDAGVSTTGEEIEQTSTLVSILAWVLPIIIFVALGQFMSRKMMEKMGGGNSMMFGDLIESKFLTEGSWNVGSALSLIMMLLILLSLSILRKADPNGEGGGMV